MPLGYENTYYNDNFMVMERAIVYVYQICYKELLSLSQDCILSENLSDSFSLCACLCSRENDRITDIYMKRTRNDKQYQFSNVISSKRFHAFINRISFIPVSFKPHQGKFSVDETWTYL